MARTPSMLPGTGATRPAASFMIAFYNAASTVGATIDSCIAQEGVACEIVVVDDGSTDDGAARVARYGPRVKLVRQPNAGLPGARNTGVAASTAEALAWMDCDDICHPARIACGLAVLEAFPDVVLVSSDFSAFRDDEPDFEMSHGRSYYRAIRISGGPAPLYDEVHAMSLPGLAGMTPVHVGNVYEQLVWGNFVHPPTVLVRRWAMERAGAFDTSLRVGCDYDQIIRLARTGRFAHIDAPLLRYRRSDMQMSHGASHGRTSVDTLATLDKVARDDPEFARRHAARLQRRRLDVSIEAAEGLAAVSPGRASGYLLRALPQRPPLRDVARIAAKIVLPRKLIDLVKPTAKRPPSDAALPLKPREPL